MANIQERVSRLISEFFADVRSNAIARGRYDTGGTVNSLEQRYAKDGDAHTFQIWANKYFMALDTGSAPARRRGTDAEREAFIRSLTTWCQRKSFPTGGLSPEQYRSFARFLKWYIGKHGSEVWRNPSMQNKIVAPALVKLEKKIESELSAFYETEIIKVFSK